MEEAEPPGQSTWTYPPADFRRRVLARCIDLLVAAAPVLLAPRGLRSPALISVVLLLCGDALFGAGRSLGKRLAGLRVILIGTRRPAGLRHSIERNTIFVLAAIPALAGAPLEISLAELAAIALLETFVALRPLTRDLGQRRFGDLLAGTQVIDGRVALGARLPAAPRMQPSAPLASRAARDNPLLMKDASTPGAACASR